MFQRQPGDTVLYRDYADNLPQYFEALSAQARVDEAALYEQFGVKEGDTFRILGRTEKTGLLIGAARDEYGDRVALLTECCQATAKGMEYGTGCRSCYRPCSSMLGDVWSIAVHGMPVSR